MPPPCRRTGGTEIPRWRAGQLTATRLPVLSKVALAGKSQRRFSSGHLPGVFWMWSLVQLPVRFSSVKGVPARVRRCRASSRWVFIDSRFGEEVRGRVTGIGISTTAGRWLPRRQPSATSRGLVGGVAAQSRMALRAVIPHPSCWVLVRPLPFPLATNPAGSVRNRPGCQPGASGHSQVRGQVQPVWQSRSAPRQDRALRRGSLQEPRGAGQASHQAPRRDQVQRG